MQALNNEEIRPEQVETHETAAYRFGRFIGRHKDRKGLLVMTVVIILAALIPLYGVLFPLNVDLAEHILISKLLWEKLSGVTHLDIEVSYFLGYRLSPIILATIIATCSVLGISLIYVPILSVVTLITGHAVVVVAAVKSSITGASWRSYFWAGCLILPAVVAMYSASWYFGFVAFTLGVTLTVPAVFTTERFLRTGKNVDALYVFLALFLIYVAHPFAEIYWLFWYGCRAIAAICTGTIRIEWKRFLVLPLVFVPIVLYNFWATSGTELTWQGYPFLSNSPFISPGDWYQNRLGGFYGGNLLKADDLADPRFFALVAGGLVVLSTVLSFRLARTRSIRSMALSSALLFFLSSWINDKFIPGPWAFWVAWDLRSSSAVYVVCLTIAAMVLNRAWPVATDKLRYKIAAVCIALLAVVASFYHLLDTRKAYARFDPPARQYVDRLFSGQPTAGIVLPHGSWNPDGSFLSHYICLQQPDCNPEHTSFKTLGGNIWAVKVKGSLPSALPAKVAPTGPVNAFTGGEGSAPGQFLHPRGITSDSRGNFYVADGGNGRIQEFDRNGNFVAQFGSAGTGPGQMTDPEGVAVDDKANVYVTDTANNKLIRYGSSGVFDKEWKGPETGFYGPNDISVGPDRCVYIVDEGHNRIVKLDPQTDTYILLALEGPGDTRPPDPEGISIGGGFIFVTDKNNNRVKILDMNGKFVRQIDIQIWGDYVWHYPDTAFDEATKRLYVTYGWGNEILAFDAAGAELPDAGFKPTGPASLWNPSSLSILEADGKKILMVLNTSGCKVTPIELGSASMKQVKK